MHQSQQLAEERGGSGPAHGEAPRRERPRLFALLIASLFGTFGIAWILLSDRILHALALPVEIKESIASGKGVGYVVVTSMVLYLLVSRPLVRLVNARERERQARADAQARARELQIVLDAVPVAVWIARDPACRLIEGNRVGRELLGQSETANLSLSAPTQDRPKGFQIRVAGRPAAPDDLPVQIAARTGEDVRDCLEEILFDDGRKVTLLGNAVPVRDHQGRVTGAVGAFIDVSQRDEALRKLHRNQLILEQAQSLGQIGSWVSDPAHHDGHLDWSRETYRIFGINEGEFDGSVDTFFSLVHPDDREAVRQASLDAIGGKSEYAIDHRIVRPDGAVRWVHERARVERDASGEPLRMIGVCQDITDRMEAEMALRESEARLRSAMDAANIICWETDIRTNETSYSRDAIEFFGLDPSLNAAIVRDGALIILPEDREEVLRRYAAMMERQTEMFETTFRSDSRDSERWFRGTGRVVRDPLGRAIRCVGVTQEITLERRAEAALRSSEEQLRLLFKSLPVPAWVFDCRTLRFLAVNDAAIASYGYTEEEFLSRTIADIRPPEERERLLDIVTRLDRGFHESGGWKHLLANGRFIDVEVTSHDLDFQGVPARVVLARDVTTARRTAEALQRSEERFRYLFNALPDPAWDWDIAADRTAFSATWPTLLGYDIGTPADRVGSWESLLHPEDRMRVLARLESCMGPDRDDYEAEYRIRCRDGGFRWVLSRGRVVERGPDGRARRMIGGITDMTERRRAEDDLRLSEARYRTLIESSPDAIVVLDMQTGRFADCNHQATRLFGLPSERLLNVGPADQSPERQPDGRLSIDAAQDFLRQAVEGAKIEFEWLHVSADGREIPCEVRLARLPDRDRVLIRGTITDITDRKLAQRALAESEERLRIFVESAPAGVAMLDREFRYIAYSRRWLTDYGLQDQDLIGRSHYEVFPEIDERWRQIHQRCLGGVAERREEDRFERADGSVDYLRWEIQPWRDSRGEVGGLVFFTEMITDRKLAEDALRASEEKYRLVLRATSDAMWDYEPATGRLQWGDNVERMFGVKIADMGDRLEGWSSRLHEEDRDRTLRSFEAAVETGEERWTSEYRFRRADGSYATVLDRAYMLRGPDGDVRRVIGAMTDITEQRHSEQLMAGQARTLELLVDGEPLERVLEEIVRILETVEPGCMGSVLLLNRAGTAVYTAAAPTLPAAYSRAINGAPIGPRVGSCGTAIYRRERVIVTDIEHDELWSDYKDLALSFGLRACWSEPVIGAGDTVLGSLAMYYTQPRGPGERELRTIAWAARLAGLAIERRQAEDRLRQRETDLRDLLNAVPDLMFRMDRQGRYLEYHAPNPSDLLVPPDKFLGRAARDVLPGDLTELCMVHLERAILTGEPQMYEYQFNGKNGLRYWEVRITRCAEEQALLLVRDVTVRRSAERRLRESEQRLSQLVRQSPLGVIVWDLNFCVAEWNNAAEKIFGWPAPEALGRKSHFILPENAVGQVGKVWQALIENRGGTRSTNPNITRDGRTIFCEWYNAPLTNADGRVFAVASIVEDVTEQRMAQQRQQLMMAELDHRVKNNLAAVISLAEQSGRTTTTFASFRESFLGRVRALSRLHNALAATRWQGANLGTMVRQTLEAFGQDATSQAVVAGPTVVLPARAAQAMGMALNELCTNAIKYGALSVPGGRIEVRWALRPAAPETAPGNSILGEAPRPRLELSWREHGGPVVPPPTRRGFGTELIEGAISYELGGVAKMKYESGGLYCRIFIEMPPESEFDPRDVQLGSFDEQ